jgi:hypothetical protein
LESLVYLENPKIFYHYKIGNFEALNATCCLLKKPEKLKTLEIFKSNKISSPKP